MVWRQVADMVTLTLTEVVAAAEQRKVMVVADPTRESASALQYILSHVVLENETLYLLHVENPTSWRNALSLFKKQSTSSSTTNKGGGNGREVDFLEQIKRACRSCGGGGGGNGGNHGSGRDVDLLEQMKRVCRGGKDVDVFEQMKRACRGGRDDEFLEQMKRLCELMQPKLKVKVLKVEMDGKDKASVILSQTKLHEIDLLVVGKRNSLADAILKQRQRRNWKNVAIKEETTEYLLENSKCRCVAVQRKGQNGGYLLHTKTHRNFWLLA